MAKETTSKSKNRKGNKLCKMSKKGELVQAKDGKIYTLGYLTADNALLLDENEKEYLVSKADIRSIKLVDIVTHGNYYYFIMKEESNMPSGLYRMLDYGGDGRIFIGNKTGPSFRVGIKDVMDIIEISGKSVFDD